MGDETSDYIQVGTWNQAQDLEITALFLSSFSLPCP